ncbi:MAG: hypothetical protein J6S97_08595 [Bacteroidales bacterium]|nr:hypothetical protein [Bacteroidales bacterium]
MKKLLSFILFLAAIISCSKAIDPDYSSEERALFTKSSVDNVEKKAPVFCPQANAWIRPSSDPYKLSSFRSILSQISKETADTLSATHYAMRIYPKSLEEQANLERDTRLKVVYTPFDYISCSAEQATLLDRSIGRANARILDLRKYSITDTIENEDGTIRKEITQLPVLYVVWPVGFTIPEELDYVIDYEVFIPNDEQRKNDSIRQAEIDSQNEWGYGVPSTKAMRSSGVRIFSGYIKNYEDMLDSTLAMANLKIRFQQGSNIVEVFTNSSGYFSTTAPYGSVCKIVYLHNRWKITESNSSTPIEVQLVSITDSWINGTNIYVNYDECPVHRALSHYFLSNHPIDVPVSQYMLLAKMTRNSPGWLGAFTAPLFSAPYIEISDSPFLDNTARYFAVVSHELGHYSHYMYVDNRIKYNGTHILLRESFAEYVSWVLSNNYYVSQTGASAPHSEWNSFLNNSNQLWTPDLGGTHSPLFIDLRDNFNQYIEYGSASANITDYNYDSIHDMPYSIIKSLIVQNKTWAQVKTQLQSYIGTYFTQNDYDQYIPPYNSYF